MAIPPIPICLANVLNIISGDKSESTPVNPGLSPYVCKMKKYYA